MNRSHMILIGDKCCGEKNESGEGRASAQVRVWPLYAGGQGSALGQGETGQYGDLKDIRE